MYDTGKSGIYRREERTRNGGRKKGDHLSFSNLISYFLASQNFLIVISVLHLSHNTHTTHIQYMYYTSTVHINHIHPPSTTYQPYLQFHHNKGVNGGDVLTESVDQSTSRRALEPSHSRMQHPLCHPVMQLTRCLQTSEVKKCIRKY